MKKIGTKIQYKNIIPFDIKRILIKTARAYQGVGDFEGTGKNMTAIIDELHKILDKYNIKWK